jgi:hypothetical protein
MPRFCIEVAGAGLARPGGLGQGTSDLRVMRLRPQVPASAPFFALSRLPTDLRLKRA